MIRQVLKRADELLAANRRFALVSLIKVKGSSPGKAGFKLLLEESGDITGTIGGGDAERQVLAQAREALAEGQSRSVEYELTLREGNLVRSMCGGTNEVFIEVFMERPYLCLLGAGHVAQATAKLCEMLEYPYVVIDDRPEFATVEAFPSATEVFCGRGDAYFARDDLPNFTHVIGLGYDAAFDLDGIIPAAQKLSERVCYGAIGSRTKYAKMTKVALSRGATEEQWARVKCPVGLSIGAQTPSEIAVSILAEVVDSIAGRDSHGWKS